MAKDNKKSANPGPAKKKAPAPDAPDSAGKAGGGPQALADLEFVKGLIEAVDSSGIDSLEITRAGTRVKISKTPPPGGGAAYYTLPAGYGANAGSGVAPAGDMANAGAAPAGAAPSGADSSGAGAAAGAAAGGVSAGGAGGGAAGGSESSGGAVAAEAAGAKSTLVEVPSPMVGTFYRAPAPEAPPYVEVGTRVAKGQTLCILEAMKLMNELESETDGVVRQVLVENAEPVEYGQVLFRIDPSG